MKTSQDRLREYYSDNEDKSINLIRESNNNSSNNSSNDSTSNSSNTSQQSKINSLFSYPSLDDENMMIKISEKREFYDSKAYEQNIDKLNEIAVSSKARYQLSPAHQ